MIYVLFAVFMGFVGSVIFKDGLFANALSTTVVFLLAIPIVLAIGGAIHESKEEEQKQQAEYERKQRVKRGHLEDDLTPQQRILWNSLHKYREDDVLIWSIIDRTKKEHEQKMWHWKYNKEMKEKYYASYCKAEREGDLLKAQVDYTTFTYYERDTDIEAKELKKIGLLDKYGNYTFWDNFPDNWKLSDEELEALDYEDDDYEHNDYEYTS